MRLLPILLLLAGCTVTPEVQFHDDVKLTCIVEPPHFDCPALPHPGEALDQVWEEVLVRDKCLVTWLDEWRSDWDDGCAPNGGK